MKMFDQAIIKLKESMKEFRDKQTLALLTKVEEEFEIHTIDVNYSPEQAIQCQHDGNTLLEEGKFVQAAKMFAEGIKHIPDQRADEDD